MPSNPYVSQTTPGTYNQNPPPDDGSHVSSNLVQWAKHTGKIGDPLRLFCQNINAAILAAFGSLVITTDSAEQDNIIMNQEFL